MTSREPAPASQSAPADDEEAERDRRERWERAFALMGLDPDAKPN